MYTEAAYGALSQLTFRGLQKEVISRGFGFMDAITKSHHVLADFFLQHFEDEPKPNLIQDFDQFIEDEIKKNPAYDKALLHPSLRLGYVPGEEMEVQKERIKPKVEAKPPREKTEDGLIKGTKKALTYALTDKYRKDLTNPKKKEDTLEKIVAEVEVAFPDAKENSIRIWVRRRLTE